DDLLRSVGEFETNILEPAPTVIIRLREQSERRGDVESRAERGDIRQLEARRDALRRGGDAGNFGARIALQRVIDAGAVGESHTQPVGRLDQHADIESDAPIAATRLE